MKQNLIKGSLILLCTFISAIACKKSVDHPAQDTGINNIQHDTTMTTPVIPYPVNPLPECNSAPNYGDSIVYPQPATNSDYYIYPQNNQGMQGTYLSWPDGLSINANTGAVNLTQSETAIYKYFFLVFSHVFIQQHFLTNYFHKF